MHAGVLCYSLPDTSTLRGRVGDLTVDIRAPGTLCLEKETYTMQKVWSAFGPDPPNFRWVLFDEVSLEGCPSAWLDFVCYAA